MSAEEYQGWPWCTADFFSGDGEKKTLCIDSVLVSVSLKNALLTSRVSSDYIGK